MNKYTSLNELLKIKLGMRVDEFSAYCEINETTLRNWFKNEKRHKALNLIIKGVKADKGW